MEVVDKDGVRGTLTTHHDDWVQVEFEGSRPMMLSRSLLTQLDDGTYELPFSAAELLVIPVMEEQLEITKETAATGTVRLTKQVEERTVLVDEPLLKEQVKVERVPFNQYITEAPPTRYEGDTMIIPVVEEVVVIEKKLVLREEIRITKIQREHHEPQQVTLRREAVSIEHLLETNIGGAK